MRVGGPFTAAQQAQVRELGLGDAIVVLPLLDRSTLAAVYRRCALVLMPSEREGFGLPVLEALACGTPVVASDSPRCARSAGTRWTIAQEDIDACTVVHVYSTSDRKCRRSGPFAGVRDQARLVVQLVALRERRRRSLRRVATAVS